MNKDAQLTPKQIQVLHFIQNFWNENGYAPTQSEIAKNFGFQSLGTVQNYLVRLQKQGVLEKTWNGKRQLRLVARNTTKESTELPLLGEVAAGRPIEAIERPDTFEVPSSMLRKGEHYVLRVKGDSMVGDGILEGDYIVVCRKNSAVNGETVVALLGNDVTVKRYYLKNKRVELHSSNPAYRPIVVDKDKARRGFAIEGIVVGVIRKF